MYCSQKILYKNFCAEYSAQANLPSARANLASARANLTILRKNLASLPTNLPFLPTNQQIKVCGIFLLGNEEVGIHSDAKFTFVAP